MKFWIVLAFSLLIGSVGAQTFPYDVHVRPHYSHPALGVQAFAYAQVKNEILIIGGRKDGLHRRQPFASMDSAGMNQFITLYNLADNSILQASINSLPIEVAEQFTSTNMEYYQEGNYLYLVGGYGYSPTKQDHQTHPVFTSIYLPDFIQSIHEHPNQLDGVQYLVNTDYAVTGGALIKMEPFYYLVAGNRFDGRYNPMGGPSYTQTYTEKIRKYTITHEYGGLNVHEVGTFENKDLLHRRDLNVMNAISPSGAEYSVLFSGVFQPAIDLPWQNSIAFNASGYREIPQYVHRMNQYHCAHFSTYNRETLQQHFVFLGGMGEFYQDGEHFAQSNDVPFVKTMAVVTQNADSTWKEEILPQRLPYYLGASSEFVPAANLTYCSEHNIDLNALFHNQQDSVMIGYLLGGIQSNAPNIFWINDGKQSFPNETMYEVWMVKGDVTKHVLLDDVFRVYPNNTFDRMKIDFTCTESTKVKITVYDYHGKRILRKHLGTFGAGSHTVTRRGNFLNKEHFYTIQLDRDGVITEQRLVVTE